MSQTDAALFLACAAALLVAGLIGYVLGMHLNWAAEQRQFEAYFTARAALLRALTPETEHIVLAAFDAGFPDSYPERYEDEAMTRAAAAGRFSAYVDERWPS